MRAIVMGSRTVHNPSALIEALAVARELFGIVPTTVITDDNIGTGRLVTKWAHEQKVPVEVHLADYCTHGEAARAVRNVQMVSTAAVLIALSHKVDAEYVDHMVAPAKVAGLEVIVWPV